MPGSRNTFKVLFLIQTLFIAAFVPWARSAQRALRGAAIGAGPVICALFVILTVLFLAISIWCYYLALRQKKSSRYSARHSALVLCAALLIITHIGRIWIEYAHVLSYATLYALARMAQQSRSKANTFMGFEQKPVLTGFLLSQTVSLGDEFLQYLHPERYADPRDLWLNFMAGALGVLLLEPLLTSAEPVSQVPEIAQ